MSATRRTSVLARADPRARLSNRLRVARAERDVSQEELARAAGVSRQTISSIETGQYCPSALLAFRLAGVLAVDVDELFWLEDSLGHNNKGETDGAHDGT